MAKKQTYADKAKSIMNKYKPRLGEKFDKGDTLALEAMNQELVALRDEQERARVQELVKNANTEQLSQFSQALQQPQGNQGPDQPGIPQGGPSGLAGGQAPQATGQAQFGCGGKLRAHQLGGRIEDVPRRQQGTLGTLGLSRETPFISSLLEGQPVPLSQGELNRQQVIYPSNLSLEEAGTQGNFVPFGQDPKAARKFMRQAPKVSERIGRKRFSGSEDPIYYGESSIPGPSRVNIQMGSPRGYATGGNLPQYQGDELYPNQLPIADVDPITGQALNAGTGAFDYTLPQVGEDALSSPYAQEYLQGRAEGYGEPGGIDITQQQTNPASPTRAAQSLERPGDGFTPFKSRVPYFGAVAQGLGSVLANRNIDFGEIDQYKPQQVVPHTISLAREREQLKRDRDIAMAGIRSGQGTGGSRAKLSQRLQAGATGTQRVLGRGASQSFQREAVTNAQIRNQAEQFNAQQRSVADRLNIGQERENLLINEQRRGSRIGGVASAATGYGRDLLAADQYDQMLQIMAPENYQFGQGRDSAFRRAVQASPTMQRFFNKGQDPRLYRG